MDKSLELGQRIQAVRSHTGLNKAVFGARIGISGTSVNNLETGVVKSPNSSVLSKISSEFDINMDWLQHGHGEMLRSNSTQILNQGELNQGDKSFAGWGAQSNFAPQHGLDLVTALEKEIEGLRALLAEKDERIQELKETIAHLRKL